MVGSGNRVYCASANKTRNVRNRARGKVVPRSRFSLFFGGVSAAVTAAVRTRTARLRELRIRFAAGNRRVFETLRRSGERNPLRLARILIREYAAAAARHREFVRGLLLTAAPAAAAGLLAATCLFWSNTNFALRVSVDGEFVGYVENDAVLDSALNLLRGRLLTCDDNKLEIVPTYTLERVSKSDLLRAGELADRMLGSSLTGLTTAAGLYVDGNFVAAVRTENEAEGALNQYLEAYKTDTGEADFYSQVQIETGLYLSQSIVSYEALCERLNTEKCISVKRVATETKIKELAFDTVEVKDNTKDASYRFVAKRGKLGKAEVTEKVVYIDGVESERTVEKTKILEKPVEKKIIVGTAQKQVAMVAAGDGIATGKFAWPVQRVARMYISSYWGDGRGHKGLDIAAPRGTLIYAADGGTVVSVSSDGQYGKHFLVDHGNGIQTRYAHCSEINVAPGQKVTRGQAVAKVGSTGYSTGPHLHFEVIINGQRVNPAPYLGLK